MNRIMFIPFLIFAWLSSGLLFLFVAELGPFYFLSSQSLLILIEEIKLFFILIILPLLLPRYNKGIIQGLTNFGVFILLFLPLTIIGTILANAKFTSLIIEHLILLFLWLIVGLLEQSELQPAIGGSPEIVRGLKDNSLRSNCQPIILILKQNAIRWYYLVIFTLSGALPLFYYLIAELYGSPYGGLLYFNPFWLLYKILYQ